MGDDVISRVAAAIETEFYRRVDAGDGTGFESVAIAALEVMREPDTAVKARELLAAQMTDAGKRRVLLSGSPASYAGGITATQALRAIETALDRLSPNLENKPK